MKLQSALVGAACFAGLATAAPAAKTCVTQAGSDANGVPIIGTDFTAMYIVWAQSTTLDTDMYSIVDGKLQLSLPDTNYGTFIIASSGTVSLGSSNYTSSCYAGCERLVCIEGISSANIPLDIEDTDSATCDSVTLAVGYGVDYTAGTVDFYNINACDANNIIVSEASAPPTPTTTVAEVTTEATTTAATATTTTKKLTNSDVATTLRATVVMAAAATAAVQAFARF